MWGVQLSSTTLDHVPTQIVLQKFLNANNGDVEKAKGQLKAALELRRKVDPVALMARTFDVGKFGGLGYVSVYDVEGKDEVEGGKKEIVSWNIYGGIEDIKKMFGDVEEYVHFIAFSTTIFHHSSPQLPLNFINECVTGSYSGARPSWSCLYNLSTSPPPPFPSNQANLTRTK